MTSEGAKQRLAAWKKKYGTSTTTNFDLLKIAEAEGITPFYVVMRDEVSSLPSSTPLYAVTNIHTSDERGVHWSALAKGGGNTKGNTGHGDTGTTGNYFFDSYALPPTQEVKDFLQHATYNTFTFQEPGTTECGQLCLFLLKELTLSKDPLETIFQIRK